jgi:hypothetical protein
MSATIRTIATSSLIAGLAIASGACQQSATNPANMASANSTGAAAPMNEADRAAYMNRHGLGFGSVDTNSDGRVTLEEANVYARQPLTSGGDSDRDGAMSAAELARAAPEVRTVLLRADTNSDGALSSAEIDARVEARFRTVDANHDGGITEQEMQAAPPSS